MKKKKEIEVKIPCCMKKGNGYAVKYKGENAWYFVLDRELKGNYPHFFGLILGKSVRAKEKNKCNIY